MSFWEKYKHAVTLHQSNVCVGLDSDISKLPGHILGYDNPIWEFNREIINATKNKVAAYKLNYAFYVASGKKGISALEKTIKAIPNYIPIILDVKVGDIGNTMAQYAKAYFEHLNVDAITVNPLMGNDVFKPLLEYSSKMIFVLVLTSNPSASEYLIKDKQYLRIADYVNSQDSKRFGAVVGGTNSSQLREIRKHLPKSIFLIPGVGAQGGDLREVVKNCAASKEEPLFLINSSRGIIFADSSEKFAETALSVTSKLRDKINRYLNR